MKLKPRSGNFHAICIGPILQLLRPITVQGKHSYYEM